MAKELETWISEDVGPLKEKPLSWLSSQHFFRDPVRPSYTHADYFFAPADGVLLYQEEVGPADAIVNVKGKPYSLREALRDPTYDRPSLVIGIFMTFFDVHINRVPYPGRLSYRQLEPIDTLNHPMLEVESRILEDLRVAPSRAEDLRHNQRMVNRIQTTTFADPYYVRQIADYDVDSITPFELKQNQPCFQGQRFSQIRYGSQVDLIIPLSESHELVTTQTVQCHVEAGVDALVAITQRHSSAEAAD